MIKTIIRAVTLSILSAAVVASAETRTKVGVLLPLSGNLVTFGTTMLASLKRADLANIELVVEDDECLPAKTISAFKKLRNVDRVSFFLGPVCGSPQQSVAPLLKQSDSIAMLVSSGAENLYELSGGKVFSPQYSNEDEAKHNALVMEQLGLKRVAMIFYDDVFCRAHEKAFRAHFKGEVVEAFAFSSFDPSVLKPFVTKLQSLQVDGIYVPDVSPFMLGLRRELAKLGLGDVPVVSIFSAQTQDVLTSEGSNANGIMYSYPEVDTTDAVGYFAQLGADIVFNAIRECTGDPSCVRRVLTEKHGFNSKGVRSGKIETRIIEDGKFVKTSVDQIRAAKLGKNQPGPTKH